MTKIAFFAVIFLGISCTSIQGNVFRDIQHEINEINIILTSDGLSKEEIQFLRGKSFGLHLALEIMAENGMI